jgi:hypothetical protein
VALVRVYCGVAAAEMAPWLTVAVVDDSGRLLEMRHISDDPAGYAYLGALLADRSGGDAPVAMDSHEHLVAQLLAAANRPLAIADELSLADFAERFTDDTSYEEVQAPLSQRCAIGLARALQAGALYAMAQSPSWNLDEFKPILAAHAAVTAGRQAAAAALREVLRELYPAALRAYPDPAEYVPLKVLEALPEPGLLSASPSSRNREAALVADLSSSGVADTTTAVSAITALRVAVDESPRWNSNRALAPVVAETVRQAVAAVRACDAASAALIATLVERLGALAGGGAPARPYLVHPAPATAPAAPVSPAVPGSGSRRPFGPAAEVPPSRLAPRASTASAAAAGVGPSVVIPFQRPEPAYEQASHAYQEPYSGPNYQHQPSHAQAAAYSGAVASAGLRADQSAQAPGFHEPGYPSPDFPAPGSRSDWPLTTPTDDSDFAAVYAGLGAAAARAEPESSTVTFSMDPLNAPLQDTQAQAQAWLAGSEPSSPLRLVDPPRDPLTDPIPDPYAPPALRVIDGGRQPQPAYERDPMEDTDLLIFSQTQSQSAWFTLIDANAPQPPEEEEPPSWGRLADDGWRAAEQVSRPAVGAETMAGLPRRVPQANLVPGSAHPPPRQLRIVRDPESIAAHTSGYFRGWQRGQEIGGYAVGQRDRAAWEFNREQRAREATDPRARR